MPLDRKDLASRIAASTAKDTIRGILFNAIFDTVEEHLGKDVAAGCDPAGKARRTEFIAFPVADFLQIAARASDVLEPKLGSSDRAFFEIGYRGMANVIGSTLGATLVALSSDVQRFLGQAASGYGATVSYGQRRLEWLGDRHARFHYTRDFLLPPFHCGVFTGAVEAFGGKSVNVEGKQIAPLDAVYDITWR
jgi:uncharacterized protein (TIGR02265 family)